MQQIMETNASDHLSEDMIKFEDTGIIEENEIFPQESLYMDEAEEENEPDDIIILHMDIRDPLTTLRNLLENKIGVDLKKYEFWLQDAQVLESHKNLVDQCVKGEGLVQINVQIQAINERINIVDVLKPTEAALATLGTSETEDKKVAIEENDDSVNSAWEENNSSVLSMDEESDREDLVVNWILDNRFRREQSRLKIPDDPQEWTTAQVKHWLQWAVRQFNLSQIKLSDWEISGKELCGLTLEDFQTKVPIDPGNVFWTHLELLRKCKFVATIQKTDRKNSKDNGPTILRKTQKVIKKPITTAAKNFGENVLKFFNNKPSRIYPVEHWIGLEQCESNRNRLGNNGQVQLWQFLLDILTDMQYKQIIQWIGGEGEFKLTDPERVAQLWGERKNKPAMNYEKLSRALRYYYDGDMISKVHGKRFVYKFVCDLKQLIGYNAQELAELVNECTYAEFC